MKIFASSILLLFLFISLSTCFGQKASLESRICKTWVSFEQTGHSHLLQNATKSKTTGMQVDSLIVRENHSIQRFDSGRQCSGVWSLSQDSTRIEFKFEDCKSYYYSLKPDAFQLSTLKGDTIMMTCRVGEEGEFTERWFRFNK